MGTTTTGGGGRAARALRLLLLFVLALAAVEYLFGSILDASPLRTYLYTPIYNATQPTVRFGDKITASWPKKINAVNQSQTQEATNSTLNRNETLLVNVTNIQTPNMTKQSNLEETTSLLVTKIIDSYRNASTTDSTELKKNESSLPLCDDSLPSDLGPIPVNKTEVELDWVEKKYPEVQPGGRYSPPNCTARHKVAIIIPFRDRKQHLAIFLNHMHPFLMKQQLDYGIYVVEQEGNSEFNRAKLMNVGFMESMTDRVGGYQCFIFHDIDLLPLDLRNTYSCPRQPRHMSASIDKLHFKLPYEDIFGGVSAMTKEQFLKVNGFSNKYWGWGGEDDDMSYRLRKMGYHIARYKMSIARYAMLDHAKSVPNPKRYQLLSQTSKVFQKDGISTLEYEPVKTTRHHLYTHVLVNIDERS